MKNYTIGIDYGSDSARGVLVDAANGTVIAHHVHNYARWAQGKYIDNSLQMNRQHPLDYLEALKAILHALLDTHPEEASQVRGISIDCTGTTPILVDKDFQPLAFRPEWSDNPDAMFLLWKDHSSYEEASLIEKTVPAKFLFNSSGTYSPECYWCKLLHVLRSTPELAEDAYLFVDACDWLSGTLTGLHDASRIRRSLSVATAKMMLSHDGKEFPPKEWFASLDDVWMKIVNNTRAEDNYSIDQPFGNLCEEYAKEFGMSTSVVVGVGQLDAFAGCIGACVKPGRPVVAFGTSSAYMLVMPKEAAKNATGVFSQGLDYIVPGMASIEMGQSSFGDVYAWLSSILNYIPSRRGEKLSKGQVIGMLSEDAEALPLDPDAPFATDFFNGRRSPDQNPSLWGSIMGLKLHTSAPEVFRALVESTCMGMRAINERMEECGIPISEIMGIGGISLKSPYVMQMLADSTGIPILIYGSEEASALGDAMVAATVAGIYGSIAEAQDAMGASIIRRYEPDPSKKAFYDARYRKYRAAVGFTEKQACAE